MPGCRALFDYGVTSPVRHTAESPAPPRTVVAQVTRVLAAAGVPSPRTDAELLTAFVLGVPRARLLLAPDLTAAQATRLNELVAARARRVPLQHLTGTAAFRHIELAVGPGVFIPRPETELLAGMGVQAAASDAIVVDLCSGSGAIALAVAHEVPTARVYAVERSTGALPWLHRNAALARKSGGRPVTVVAGDATDPATLHGLDGRVDVVLCNPPYVPDATAVPPEVASYDPAEAVFGGPDGLEVIRGVIDRAAALLRPGGFLGIEHDDTHTGLLRGDPRFTSAQDHVDLAGRPRFATARRR